MLPSSHPEPPTQGLRTGCDHQQFGHGGGRFFSYHPKDKICPVRCPFSMKVLVSWEMCNSELDLLTSEIRLKATSKSKSKQKVKLNHFAGHH